MKIRLLVASLFGLMGTGVMAQSAFQGFYGQLGTGYENNSLSSLGSTARVTPVIAGAFATTNPTVTTTNQTASGMPLVVGVGYNFAISKDWLIGVGGDYSFVSQKTDTYRSTVSNGNVIPGQQTEISNRYNIFVTPGYVIDKEKLAYLKAGYSNQQLKYTAPANNTGTSNDPAQSISSTVGGYVLGLGYKQIITGGLYAFAEGNYMQYSKANLGTSFTGTTNTYRVTTSNNTGSNAYTLLVGVGYKF
jgi:opacity protein-like surface antigen